MPKAVRSTRQERTRAASSERRERQKRELRASILAAASDEFLAQGYDGFSLRRVAERIGYSPTTIYLYFQNKDELILSTVAEGFIAFDQTIKSVIEGQIAPLEQLRSLGRAYFDFGLRHPALYRLMFMQRADFFLMPRLMGSGTPPEALETPAENSLHHHVVAQELLVEAVRTGIAAGQLRTGDPVQMADMLWASVHGLVSLAISPLMEPEHAQKLIDNLLETLINGLKAPITTPS